MSSHPAPGEDRIDLWLTSPHPLEAFRVKRPVPRSISTRRWTVLASMPVVSERCLAASVSAEKHFTCLALGTIRTEFTNLTIWD